jgi:YjjI family glycine radical enzyme
LVSCYNGLYVGGGAYTLSRLRLGRLAATAQSLEDFWERLDHASAVMQKYMDSRIEFMVLKSGFFESNFLAKEGFINRERFTAMFGIVGLAECVNYLMKLCGHPYRYGHDKEADDLGLRIMDRLDELMKAHRNQYCEITDNQFLLHGQVGIDLDLGESPATRIPIGNEPDELIDHIMHSGKFHRYFPSGTGDVFVVEPTAHKNPQYVLDIVNGGFSQGVRYLSIHAGDSDVIRVTGYLVKKSEMEELSKGNSVLRNTTALGLGSVKNAQVLERRRR